MRYKLVLIFSVKVPQWDGNPTLHTQMVEEAYTNATAAMNAGQEFIKNLSGQVDCYLSFSVFPGN